MLTITLDSKLAEQIRQAAGDGESSAADFVEKAVRSYLAQFAREKIEAEAQFFERQKESLLKTYRGEYVAVHQGRVIDHDPDLRTLHLRVFSQFGHMPVLLRQVVEEPERELTFRSPRLESR